MLARGLGISGRENWVPLVKWGQRVPFGVSGTEYLWLNGEHKCHLLQNRTSQGDMMSVHSGSWFLFTSIVLVYFCQYYFCVFLSEMLLISSPWSGSVKLRFLP